MSDKKSKKTKREHTVRFHDIDLLKSVKNNLPSDWFEIYLNSCRKAKIEPLSYPQIIRISNGYSINADHFYILECIVEDKLKKELQLKSLLLKNKKINEELEAA